MKKREYQAKVSFQKAYGDDLYQLGLSLDSKLPELKGGEFVMLSCGSEDLTLRRPMAIYDFWPEKKEISILYHVVGKGTKALSELEVGAKLSLLGPLGNHFPSGEGDKKIWLVAGGIGVAPFYAWLKCQEATGLRQAKGFFGFRNDQHATVAKDFSEFGIEILVAAEGSKTQAFKKFVTEPLLEQLNEEKPDAVYVCGPTVMMEAVRKICEKENLPCYVSLEAKMACGMGVCLSCITDFPVRSENKQNLVCTHGPIFQA